MSGVALVTGASRGIGRAIALQLAQDGYAVAIHCHQQVDSAQAVCDQIRAQGGAAAVFCCDVADESAVQHMAADVTAQLGPVSVLVNNAGFAQQ